MYISWVSNCRIYLLGCLLVVADFPGSFAAPQQISDSHETKLAGDVIVQWNQLAYESAFAEDQFSTFKGQRAIAMVHLAQHDALNAIARRFESYALKRHVPEADPLVAAAQAAREVLLSEYPSAQGQIDALLERQLATTENSSAKTRGIQVGRDAAAAVLKVRENDGWQAPGEYEFKTHPGAYQTTPDWKGFVLHPELAQATPFMLKTASQLRASPPPNLRSRAYAHAWHEVKKLGERDSTHRTPDQTAAAVWWMEFSEGLVNRLTRRLVNEEQLELWRTARLFALMNAALVDTYVAVWDSKYEFNHWRPYTAIRNASMDGNHSTRADSQWDSLRPAPPFPEYVSAHAAGCACTLSLLGTEFGSRREITLDSLTAPPDMPTRSFESFKEAARECADSRIWLGFHFSYSTRAGTKLGRRSAQYARTHYLRPIGSFK